MTSTYLLLSNGKALIIPHVSIIEAIRPFSINLPYKNSFMKSLYKGI